MFLIEKIFTYEVCPKEINSKYPLLVLINEEEIFYPLTDYYKFEIGRIESTTALSYIRALISFFNWLVKYSSYQGLRVKWDMEPKIVREAIREYLVLVLHTKVNEHHNGQFMLLKITSKTSNKVKSLLAALKSFYKVMKYLKKYNYNNPLIDQQAQTNYEIYKTIEREEQNRPKLPYFAGTEEKTNLRLTNTYFKLINDVWSPNIIDDPTLPNQVLMGGKKAQWSLRDTLISRMLFESGARASEVIELEIGDYRNSKNIQEVNTFSKGSGRRRVKFLRFSNDTIKLLMKYIDTERRSHDKSNTFYKNLPDKAPLFLSERGTKYTYKAWYYHWNKGCKMAEIKVNPHKTRHWYVTQAIRTIYEHSDNNVEIKRRIRELIEYIKWLNKDTIQTYEHYFDSKNHSEIQDQLFKKLKTKKKIHREQVNETEIDYPSEEKNENIINKILNLG